MSRVKKNTLTILLIAVALIVAIMLWIMTRDKSTYMPSVPVARASDALAALSADMPLYTVDAVYDPSAHKLTGTQSVSFTTTGQQLTSIILRAYANAYSSEDTSPAAVPELFLASYGGVFDKGGIAVSAFTVNGEPKAFRYADDYNILIEVADVAIAPLSSVELSFNFSLTLPKLKGAFSYSGDTAILSNPFPILAEIDEFGWITDSVPLYGDGYASKPNNWRVNITAPEGYTVAGSGSPETEGGAIVAYASRGFSFFAGKAGQVSADVNGIIVTVLGSNASSILSEARDIISYYEDVYGKYPWQSLVVLSADIPQDYIVGSCFIVINSKLKDRTLPPAEAVAKQYFGELAGSDNLGQPWLSESVSAFAS
ncbi:MAG: hypothetical protein LBD16_04105, partial [Oscillospiraceae bacterium]|nr:hypothetical protein [Oscillospiraceae bacterium]